MTTVIKQADFIQSVRDALQYISYYHPLDYIKALTNAYHKEKSTAAKDAIAQILVNSKMSAMDKRPICQDTGIVTAFIKIGMDVQWQAEIDIEAMVNEGVRQAYLHPDNVLRASIVADPAGERNNTRDNTPAVTHTQMVLGNQVEVTVAAKGGGSENKSKFKILNPSDSVVDWIVDTLPTMGAGWCPPGILGVGIGGTAEKAMLLAKESLMQSVDIHDLIERGPANHIEALRLELYEKINALGIGAQGLGGMTTVLDVKIMDYPTHAASLPVAIIPNCAATRHAHFTLDGTGPVAIEPPRLEEWPDIVWEAGVAAKRIDLDKVTPEDVQSWKPGDMLLLSGKLLTGRDAAHRRIAQYLAENKPLPDGVNFKGRFIYYVGPVDAVRDEAVGPAGPTTSTRMDKYTEMMLGQCGLMGMVGKAERDKQAIKVIKQHKAVYLIAVGGAAYLVSKAVRAARVVAFEDLGMEAIHEFVVEDMPVTVAVDSLGESVHETGPSKWKVALAL